MTTANQIRKEVKKMYQKHFAVVKMQNTGLSTEFCVSNGSADDFTAIAETLKGLGFNVITSTGWNKNSFVVKA